MRHVAALSILLIVIAVTLAAQDKPDFSGRWVLVTSRRSDPEVALSLTVRQPITRTSVFGASMAPSFLELSVEREFVSHARTETYQIGVEGGVVGGLAGTEGSQTRFSVRWEGTRLVIETGSYSGSNRQVGPYTEHIEEWALDSAGMLTLSIADRSSDMESQSNTLTYRRN